MNDDAIAIFNLLYIYAERIDDGDFDGAAAMFADADVTFRGQTQRGAAPILEFWRTHFKLQPDGTPRCKHVTTNPILEFSDDRQRATVRSYYTVTQATDLIPLQVITSGRYRDAFEKVDGKWRFAARIYAPADLLGNTSDYIIK